MFSIRRRAAVVAVSVIAMAGSVVRAEQVDSPRYQAWANFKVGTIVILDGTMSNGPMEAQTELKEKLVELTPDSATVELTSTMTVMGQQHISPTRKQQIAAKEEKQDITEAGEESIDAMGKTFKCKILELKNDTPGPGGGSAGQLKIWVSPEVPGGAVKMSFDRPDPKGKPISMMYLLKSFEAAK